MLKIVWGDSVFIHFETVMEENGTYVHVDPDPDSIKVVVEPFKTEPDEVIFEIPEVVRTDVGHYYALFHADKEKLHSGKSYYVSIYWKKDGVQKCERVPVNIVPFDEQE